MNKPENKPASFAEAVALRSLFHSLDRRLTALEKSCSDSHAPSSAGSGGTDGPKPGTGSGTGTAKPTSTPSSTSNVPTARVVANQFCIQCHGRGSVGGEECDCVYVADATSDSALIAAAKEQTK